MLSPCDRNSHPTSMRRGLNRKSGPIFRHAPGDLPERCAESRQERTTSFPSRITIATHNGRRPNGYPRSTEAEARFERNRAARLGNVDESGTHAADSPDSAHLPGE